MTNYQVLDILKHAVSMLPPVYARPDPSELGPIASSKSTDTAIKNYRMLPEQLIYPLRGPSLIDRRGEKVFYFSGGATTHWFGYARQHALVTGIRAQEHPSLGLRLEGTFEDAYDQTRELFFTHGADLYYAGRYRCLRIEEVIGDHEITGYLNYHIIPNTFKAKMISAAVDAQPPRSSTDLNPPLDFKAIKELCSKGIIKFEVVALQCMSFDHEVFVALGGEYRTPSVPVVERFLGMLSKSMAHSDTPQLSDDDSDASNLKLKRGTG
ncbi:hypothetical protein BT96DRAFT_1023639 [Gymnopus androsaceus JB14]|uniref:Uncharacterized protein n=1 Tax=Gymnopus androsaceus JB14 TaxID=1447944 RepID=A0A6A4H3J4_9AGAR|nr:hypothetical protein BT96DRAFT_1023639 [Gymnopus androsaceus JB14]